MVRIQGDFLQTLVHTHTVSLPSITVPNSSITKFKNVTLPIIYEVKNVVLKKYKHKHDRLL